MKKNYIEPQNTIIALKSRVSIMYQSEVRGGGQGTSGDHGEGREAISTPDAWEEW